MNIKKYFTLEKDAPKKLMGIEWVILIYTMVTLLIVLFGQTKLANPDNMIWDRLRMAAITVAMWLVYRLLPCRVTRFLRILAQLGMLSWWYVDTYHINCLFPNLDHTFATIEQHIFGCQPALYFADKFHQVFFSELMDMAYASYFPIIATVIFFYFFRRYKEFEKACFVILASFFAFYLIYDIIPVTGPMYYYHAVGIDQIEQGIFPSVGNYFIHHKEMMTSPGYPNGLFYQIVNGLHDSGEHPTAAFPSSHVGISLVCLLLAWHTGNRKLFLLLLPFATLICLATVYIRAHYVIDVFAGLVFGVVFYLLFLSIANKTKM